jgi:homoserine dehydrogenase
MPPKLAYNIGLVGFGTVGQGVWKNLHSHLADLQARTGVRLAITRIAVRDVAAKRGVKVAPKLLTDDALALVADPQVDIVCELMGGTALARKVTEAALKLGKPVISANKALLCEHGRSLFRMAADHNTAIYYEASVAGGIPIIKALREGLVANRFPLIYGILNGTCNYILTRMQREAKPFADILADARRLGYVEADESLDIDGWDAAHKTAILAYLAHGQWVGVKDMPVTGIRDVALEDIQWADRLGYKIKLVSEIVCDIKGSQIFVSVQPSLVPQSMALAGVDDVFNAVSVTGDVVGESVYIGRGAGQDATSSAVISDIVDAVLDCQLGNPRRVRPERSLAIAPPERVRRPFYLRLQVKDQPGVLSEIASILASHKISIESVLQSPGGRKGTAQLVLTTHITSEQSMADTLAALRGQKAVLRKPFVLRIADFHQSLN